MCSEYFKLFQKLIEEITCHDMTSISISRIYCVVIILFELLLIYFFTSNLAFGVKHLLLQFIIIYVTCNNAILFVIKNRKP